MRTTPFVRSLQLAIAAAMLTVLAGVPPTQSALAAPLVDESVILDYDCDAAPWDCEGARAARRYQVWAVECGGSGCFWRWQARANPGYAIELEPGGFYRMFFAPDNDFDNMGDFRYSGCNIESPGIDEICLEIFYQCSRFPQLCDGTNAWQLYSCSEQRDGSCVWTWEGDFVGNATGVFDVLPLERYLLFWGPPRGYVPPTPTPPPSSTPRPSSTPTTSPQPSSTPTASSTGRPTDVPSETPTASVTYTATPPRPSTSTATARATDEPATDFLLFLPRTYRPAAGRDSG